MLMQQNKMHIYFTGSAVLYKYNSWFNSPVMAGVCLLLGLNHRGLTVLGATDCVSKRNPSERMLYFQTISGKTPVIIPGTVTSVAEGAFAGSNTVTSVVVPPSVKAVGDKAFANCTSLVSMVWDCTDVTTIRNSMFAGCCQLQHITLHDRVKRVCEGVFAGCMSLDSIALPNSVEYIERRAFAYCGLIKLTLPPNVGLGVAVFENCRALKRVDAIGQLLSVPAMSFLQCTELEACHFKWVGYVGNLAFGDCTSLAMITLPDKIYVHADAFARVGTIVCRVPFL